MPVTTSRPGGQGTFRLLSGWGRTAPTVARVVCPPDADAVASVLADDRAEAPGAVGPEGTVMSGPPFGTGVIARGLGRSYGDAAQCAGGVVVSTAHLTGMSWVDADRGVVEVGAGVSLQELLAWALPQGWFVPVTPGTRQVTVGGAIAADVHGKNHHRDGSFCGHVLRCELATPTGVADVGPDRDPELFWATAGGMGLTGVVTRAQVQMIPVETSAMVVDTVRFEDLDGVMGAMEAADSEHRYSVAWVDCAGRGRRLGRAVLTLGEHATVADLPAGREAHLVPPPSAPRIRVPVAAPGGLLHPVAVRAFNDAWFRRAPRRRIGALEPFTSFFHPLDAVADWNLLYGRRGFVQYQFVVPPAQSDVVHRAVRWIGESGVPSFLAVLKRFGPGDPGPLSFPFEGWTLALDFPVGPAALPALLDRLDTAVVEAAGRVYLAKDARLAPELLGQMYPDLPRLAVTRRRVDPAGRLRSDLSRRLGLDGSRPSGAPRSIGGLRDG